MTMAEFTQANESLNNWSSLVCMPGFKGLANDVEPEHFFRFNGANLSTALLRTNCLSTAWQFQS
jgi:hypothetical protein